MVWWMCGWICSYVGGVWVNVSVGGSWLDGCVK